MFKSHFQFNKQERSGIFFLLLIIVVLQAIYFYVTYQPLNYGNEKVLVDTIEQARIDSLKQLSGQTVPLKIYPFNPNFITDHKGYTLGMTLQEIDKLHAFRKAGNYVNSAKQFQEITQVSDSLLEVLAPFFKFPEWTQPNSNESKINRNTYAITKKILIRDLNSVSAQDLKMIHGIGDKLSVRIIKFRDRLGGFLVKEQLYDVYGLKKEVADKVLNRFQVVTPPKTKKINLNTASEEELSTLVYFGYGLAKKIVVYRNENGPFTTFEDLFNIEDFPINKIDRITLYLSL